MAYKVGFLLSLVFIISLFVFASDIVSVQIIYTNLDAVSLTVGNMISQKATITQEMKDLVYNQTGGYLVEVGENLRLLGTPFKYKITRSFDPVILKSEEMEITVVRSVIIGYVS